MRERSEREERLVEQAATDVLERRPAPTADERLCLDETYLRARESFETAFEQLAFAVEYAPPPHLKERLMARIAAEPVEPAPALPPGSLPIRDGIYAVRVDQTEWVEAPIAGVSFKVLHRDEARRMTTRLVRFAPGLRYPTHRHGGTEELFVLSGSVVVNGLLLRAGDYCRSEAGTDESGSHTDEGAIAIIVSSDADEIELPPSLTPSSG